MKHCLTLICLLFGSCALGPGEFVRRPEQPVCWPPDSESPRISVLFSYHDSADAEFDSGALRRFGDWAFGKEIEYLGTPYGLSLLPNQNLVIADTGLGKVHLLSLLTCQHQVVPAVAEFPLTTPVGVAAMPSGGFLVSDSTSARIGAYHADGSFDCVFASHVNFGRPTGMAWDEIGNRLLVLDTTGSRLLVLSAEGELLHVLGRPGEGPGEFNHPTNLAVGSDGTIYVMDSLNFRVQIFNPDLTPASQFGVAGSGPGSFSKPKGIAVDSEDHIYVVDAMFDNIQVFDIHGNLLLAFARSGSGFGRLALPSGLFIDSLDRIFVADGGNSRIQVFQYHSLQP